MVKTIVFFTFLIVSAAACSGERLPSLLVSNSWELTNKNVGKLEKIHVKELIIDFNMDGTWGYTYTRSGITNGGKLKGTGSWLIKGNELLYSAGNIEAKCNISIVNGLLMLSPDPVLVIIGLANVDTTYSRVE